MTITQQPPTQQAPDLWRHMDQLTRWLDGHNGRNPQEITLRIMKIGEEFGEVVAAHIGAAGQNPRKGVNATDADVITELCDVIITAMVAATTVAGGAVVARDRFASRVDTVLERALADSAPPCPACGGRRVRWLALPVPGGSDAAETWSCECGHEFTITDDGFAAADGSS